MASISRMVTTTVIASGKHGCLRSFSTAANGKRLTSSSVVKFYSWAAAQKSINRSFASASAVGLLLSPAAAASTQRYGKHLPSAQQLNQKHSNLLLPQQINHHQYNRNFCSLQNKPLPALNSTKQQHLLVPHNNMATFDRSLSICTRDITKNMTLYTSKPFKGEVDAKTLQLKTPTGKPMVLMMSWLMAKQKHLKKYAEIYTDLGFDVVVVHITPWQLLWPVKGTQVVAAETLKFLENNASYGPIVLHGFSVGAYQFGEIMLQMSRDMNRYQPILDRILCQVWDSAADITEIPVGLPKSIFPKNPSMESALRNYTLYHLKTFHNQATIHYIRSSQMFHSTLLKKPAMFFVSENDRIGPPSSNNAVRENWERANIPVTFKCWERSVHAAHYLKHRDEYLEYLFKHLENSGVLQAAGNKSRAKL